MLRFLETPLNLGTLGPALFWYRSSPAPLVRRYLPDFPGPLSVGGVTARDPVLSRPGEAVIRFDSLGRLRGFQAIPVAASADAPEPPAADWNALFEYAQLEPSAWTEVPADFIPPVYADRRASWSTARFHAVTVADSRGMVRRPGRQPAWGDATIGPERAQVSGDSSSPVVSPDDPRLATMGREDVAGADQIAGMLAATPDERLDSLVAILRFVADARTAHRERDRDGSPPAA